MILLILREFIFLRELNEPQFYIYFDDFDKKNYIIFSIKSVIK